MHSFLIETWKAYHSTDVRMLSSSIAFFVILSLAPLGVVVLGIAAIVIPEELAEQELVSQLTVFLGKPSATFIASAIDGTTALRKSIAATAFSVLFMLYVSIRLFAMIRNALNHLWHVRLRAYSELMGYRVRLVRRRLMGFLMLFSFAVSLVVLVAFRTILSVASQHIGHLITWLPAGNSIVATCIFATLIMLLYRLLPDARIAWRDAMFGAAVTSLLIVGGSSVIGIYLGYASPASAYGAAGTLLVLLLWIYYTTQIFLFGAVLTRLWAERRGRGVTPLSYAMAVTVTSQPVGSSGGDAQRVYKS